MKTGPSALRILLIPLLVVASLAPAPTQADEAGNNDAAWNGDEVDTEGWLPIPGSEGDLGKSPSIGASDDFVYEARLACTDGDMTIFPACSTIMPSCSTGSNEPQGEAGTAIYWYRADKSVSPLIWHYFSGPTCIHDEQPRDLLAEIAGQIATEFQRTPVVAAEFGSQPGPHTLRGKETNVWATATTQTFNLTMLGQNVTITATPVAYTWNYGDGTIWGPTPIHGAPLHQDRIGEQTQTSHIYTETGRLTISVTTHFDGTYTVNGGPELPIPGQGNIPSPAQPLTVWRAETHLYADDCIVNPNGIGC
ncbi:PKD domain-containing protein [Specibacter sp. NPDC078692]|uniref:PKD domain-containing protein n=1 Tax=Specibacter sp. NPDC078692 TaxID=3155818 RepID=UPI003443E7A8